MICRRYVLLIAVFGCALPVRAQPTDESRARESQSAGTFDALSARQAVRQGNLRLMEGDTESALEAYTRARELRPDAPQVPFVQGLAELGRKDFDAARDLFRETAASDDDALADDAQYALGASYHLEAIESENPQEAIEKLEVAMERYREVLARRPDHTMARESDYKAASMRRQLKQFLQQQQQEQQQNQDKEEQENQEDQEQQQSESKDQQDGEQQEQQEQSQSESQDGEDQQQQSADPQQNDEQDQSEQQQTKNDQEQAESDEQQEAQARENQEEVSREQAERRLREMMQSIRDKQKQRRQQARKVPLRPVEKDW